MLTHTLQLHSESRGGKKGRVLLSWGRRPGLCLMQESSVPTYRTAPPHIPLPNMGGGSGGKRALWALGAGVRPRDAWNPWRHLEGHTFHRPSPPAPAKTQGSCDISHPPTATLPGVRKDRAVAEPVLCPAGMLTQTPLLVCTHLPPPLPVG